MKITEYTNARELMGQNLLYTDLKFRNLINSEMTPEELKTLKNGSAGQGVLDKLQNHINNFVEETRPRTEEELIQSSIDKYKKNEADNLERDLVHLNKRLQKLNTMEENDEVLPIGERKRLKGQIESIQKKLESINPPIKETPKDDGMKDNLQSMGFDVESFIADFEKVTTEE